MTLAERLRAIANALPADAAVTLPVAMVRAWLDAEGPEKPPSAAVEPTPDTWRTKLWECPEDTRLNVSELAEAVDRSPDWCYRATSAKWARKRGREPLPCTRLDGVLVFRAGAVRAWLSSNARVVQPEPRRLRVTR
jgi:hypothetical protein